MSDESSLEIDDTADAVDQPPNETPAGELESAECTVTTESIIEAILFASDSPVPAAKIAQIIGVGGVAEVKRHIEGLNSRYGRVGSSFRIEEIAKGYQMLTLPEFNIWLRKLLRVRKESKLSSAALETLAVVAYRQPVIRAAIEEIRGVAVGEVLQRLREMNLVKIVGRSEVIGRPLLYGTTKRFLEVFGLASLDELPSVELLTPPDRTKGEAAPGDAGPNESAVDDEPDEERPVKFNILNEELASGESYAPAHDEWPESEPND